MTHLVDGALLAAADLERTFPATDPQQEIWAASRLGDDASCSFNESVLVRLRGVLDVAALHHAVGRLVHHHEALRSTFCPADGRVCVARVMALDLPLEDLTGLPEPERDARAAATLAGEVATPFDLARGPLLRLRLVRLRTEHHALIVTAHQFICDRGSMALLLRDLGQFYGLARGGGSALIAPAVPFSEYARRSLEEETRAEFARSEAYWRSQYCGERPVLDLPTDRPRLRSRTYRAGHVEHVLDANLVQALKRLSAGHGANLSVTLLSAYVALLHRLTGQRDLVVGIWATGQSGGAMSTVVGPCARLLPIRARLDPAAGFAALLQHIRGRLLDAQEHQRVSLGRLLQTLHLPPDPSRPPLVATTFNLDAAGDGKAPAFAGLIADVQSNPRLFAGTELSVHAAEVGGRVMLECLYNTDLFDAETVRDRLTSFEEMLHGIVTSPGRAVARLPLLSRGQQERLLPRVPAATPDGPPDRTLVALLADAAARAADRPAVTCGAASLGYAELHARANRLAHHLRGIGVGRGAVAGLCVERSADLLVGILGVLKAGAACLPLEPAHPRERLVRMLADARAEVVLTQQLLLGRLPADGPAVVCLDRAALDALPDTPPPDGTRPEDIAYVMFTPGPTGQLHAVPVPHGHIAQRLRCLADEPGLTEDDVLVALASPAIDRSVPELLGPLTVGARVVVATREEASDGHRLARLLADQRATAVQGTPATWRMLVQAGWRGSDALAAWNHGEPLPADLARALLGRAGRVYHLHGPTEATGFCTAGRLTDPDRVHIGRPVAGVRVYVLDANLEPVPRGVPGDLYVGGAGVVAGYLNHPELTAQRFVAVPDDGPFAEAPDARLYRTGDRARWRGDGMLEYLGRTDRQLTLRGFRVEPAEVEAALARHPAVRQAAVVAREDRPGDVRLAAYVVPPPGQAPTVTELRRFLKQVLPDYLVPQHVVAVEALPLTADGKLDASRLPAPFAATPSLPELVLASTAAEQYVARLWQETLHVAQVSAGDNFFQLGGQPPLAQQLLDRVEQETGVRLPPEMLSAGTLTQLAAQIPPDRLPDDRPATSSSLLRKLRAWLGG